MNKEKVIERITNNEEILNNIKIIIDKLETSIINLENNQERIKSLNKYYGSKDWFKDKGYFEKGKIKDIKAGVLGEDEVWNLLQKIKELNEKLNYITDEMWKD